MTTNARKRIVFFTGAGLSAESGLLTYRGSGGIWDQYNWEEVACQRAFERDPEKVWAFHHHRRELFAPARPSPAHRRIATVEGEAPDDVAVITQNIDGLHARAGTRNLVELHGNLWRVRCPNEACPRHGPPWAIPPEEDTDGRCSCGGWLRPDIVWFEDPLDDGMLRHAAALAEAAHLFVTIGTSGVVWPAAGLPDLARRAGARLVEINPEETPQTELHDEHLGCGAAEGLDRLFGATGCDA